jgi:hypothetical protein
LKDQKMLLIGESNGINRLNLMMCVKMGKQLVKCNGVN